MSGTFTVDSSLFSKKTKALLREIEKDEGEFLTEQAALLFRDASKFTPPFGNGLPTFDSRSYGTGKDNEAGEIAVRGDVRRSMAPVAPSIKWRNPKIRKAVRRRDLATLQQVFDNAEGSAYHRFNVELFDEAFHTRARDSRGRVRKEQKRLVLPIAEYKRYLEKVVSRVGSGKALFASASIAMGGPAAPKWISRHFMTSSALVTKGPDFRQASASGVQLRHTIRFLPRIEKVRAENAEKRLLYLTGRAIKKSGFRAA